MNLQALCQGLHYRWVRANHALPADPASLRFAGRLMRGPLGRISEKILEISRESRSWTVTLMT